MHKIYLVEDNDDLREMIDLLLVRYGYQVLSFAGAQEFKMKIKQESPDLVILDVMLPDGNGLEICHALKNDDSTRHIPVVLMSANTVTQTDTDKCCASDFISKPFDIKDFVSRVKKYV